MRHNLNTIHPFTQQNGLSYVEVLLSTIILAVAIVPAMESLTAGIQTAAVHENVISSHYSLMSRMQEVKSLNFTELLNAANTAGGYSSPSSYSDIAGAEPRVLVYLSYYDAFDSDSDGNVFTIFDNNTDSDNNPYTTPSSEMPLSIMWLSIELENSDAALQTLVIR